MGNGNIIENQGGCFVGLSAPLERGRETEREREEIQSTNTSQGSGNAIVISTESSLSAVLAATVFKEAEWRKQEVSHPLHPQRGSFTSHQYFYSYSSPLSLFSRA